MQQLVVRGLRVMRGLGVALLSAFLACALCVPVTSARAFEAASSPSPRLDYPLDDIARVLPPHAALPCDQPLVSYRGKLVRYAQPARVNVAFVPRLAAFEQVLIQQSVAWYGRAPRQLRHLGAQNCRRMRLYPDWVSEHALGNGIDIAGFDFGALSKSQVSPPGMPRSLRGGFGVSIDKHWKARGDAGVWHGRFLRSLAQALIDRPDIFRVLLGPAFPGHKNHFHFDCAPYRVVEIFEPGDAASPPPS